ncbi:adhesin [Providencia zhijiangensis]|uniref:Adhesin n=1 Tax=Providencia zhijiangensis TaxID=3053982 RepID=A0ABZ0N3F8_9GAMM|nr:adhesin [Providencia sp. D4759]WPA92853.1 adhesin [Providencia sp. D4759]
MKKTSKTSLISLMTMLMSLFLYSQVSHGLTRYSSSGGGYRMNLVSNNSVIASTPTIASNGEKYYSVAPPNKEGIVINESSSQPYGTVYCKVNFLVGNYQNGLAWNYAFHRVFAYMPEAGFSIKGLTAYKINANTYFTLYSDNGITQGWKNISGRGCSSEEMGPLDAGFFTVQFPFEVRIYVKDIPIDGKVVIPPAMIAGYTRMFQYPGTPDVFVPADKASVKLDLTQSVINYPSNCKSNIDNLNINHNTLDAIEFDSKQTRTATYQCDRSQGVRVKFALDYVMDNDPQKRVPLKSGNNTIYSELSLYDAESNYRGKTIETTIDKVKNIEIESHLYGLDAEPGKYTGNAWLIATYL